MIKKIIYSFIFSNLLTLALFARPFTDAEIKSIKEGQLGQFETMKREFAIMYAPLEYKGEEWHLEFQNNFEKAVAAIKSEDYSQKNADQIYDFFIKTVNQNFNKLGDYHVAVTFESNEESRLPFRIRGAYDAQGKRRFAVIGVDEPTLRGMKLDLTDEILEMDGKPVEQALQEVMEEIANADSKVTARKLGENSLTRRRKARGMMTPKGDVLIKVGRKNGEIVDYKTQWEYFPHEFRKPETLKDISLYTSDGVKIANYQFMAPKSKDNDRESDRINPHQIGNKETYVPNMGKIIWETPPESLFKAYLYEKDGAIGGYIRINTYSPEDLNAHVEEFASIMKVMKKSAGSLFIDQLNNPGGSVIYLYTLVSMLGGGKDVNPPKHQITLNAGMVAEAVKFLDVLLKIPKDDDKMAQEALGEFLVTWKVDYTLVKSLIKFNSFIIDEWNKAKVEQNGYPQRVLTDATHLTGPEVITPYWDKDAVWEGGPVMILQNALCFSGGDFFPFIMCSNGSAISVGEDPSTAGAGGYVDQREYSESSTRVASVTRTGSLAEGVNGKPPIENNGNVADHIVEVMFEDLRDGFDRPGGYGEKLRAIDQKFNPANNKFALTPNEIKNMVDNFNAGKRSTTDLNPAQKVFFEQMILFNESAKEKICGNLFSPKF